MSSVLSGVSGLATGAVETAAGFGLGVAVGRALGPLATSLEQEAYSADPSRALDPADAARIVAQALKDLGWGQSEAANTGIDGERFSLLEQSELRAPTVGELLQLIRRAQATDADITHALRKAQLEPQWDDRIKGLAEVALTPAEVATAIHRNIMPAPGLIVTEPPTTPGRVPQVPQSPLNPVEQAAWYGTTAEQLRVLVGITGLPPGLMEMLSLLNRGEVTEDDVKRAVAQSNLRNEYMDVVLGLKRRLLTPHEYEEGALRGIITTKQADDGAALSGMEQQDAQFLFELMGRPLAVHQIATGLARSGKYGDGYDTVPEPYRDAIRRSNIRPEYAGLAYANRYTIPSYFILRAILQDGGMTMEQFADYGKQLGWPPDLAEKAAKAIGGASTAGGGPYTKKAEAQLWTATHKAYTDYLVDQPTATAALEALGAAPDDIAGVFKLWDIGRQLGRRTLTVKQITDAIGEPGRDQAWAHEQLMQLGFTSEDADIILYQPPTTATAGA